MPLKALYTSQDEIPETFRELYEERGGQYHLTKIEGIKTDADVSRVQRALDAEKQAHGQIKTQFTTFLGDRKLEDVQAILDRVPELEAAAAGNLDEEKINGIVEGRINSKLAPVARERDQLKTQLSEKDQTIAKYEARERTRTIGDAVREAAVGAKVVDTAQEDVLILADRVFEIDESGNVVTKDGVGVTPGLDAKAWLSEMQNKRPHWWPPSSGGGANGGGGGGFADNPWAADSWNMTKQGEVLRTKGRDTADRMAKAAGTSVGGPKPAVKK